MSDWQQDAERASQGDREAVAALIERYLPRLLAFVRLRMGAQLRAKESACDLVQSACREVLARLPDRQFQAESGFRHYLFTTALRKVRDRVDFYAAEKRDVEREVPAPSASHHAWLAADYADLHSPSAELSLKEQLAMLEAAFATLSEDHREVITLARIVGLSHNEIAQAMGRSEEASRMLLYRALGELSTALSRRPA